MLNITREELTNRLGLDPVYWTFLGQCYNPSANPTKTEARRCAITGKPSNRYYTIKPRTGNGRKYISDDAFETLEYFNPELRVRLGVGQDFLSMREGAFAWAVKNQEFVEPLRVADGQYKACVYQATFVIREYRRVHPKGSLPKSHTELKRLLSETVPSLPDNELLTLWFRQKVREFQTALMNTAPPQNEDFSIPEVKF